MTLRWRFQFSSCKAPLRPTDWQLHLVSLLLLSQCQVNQNDTGLNDLLRFLWKTWRMPECGFRETANRGCQLGPNSATTSTPTAHQTWTAWAPATPCWTGPAEQFPNMPAEGKSCSSLQERVNKATNTCCWPQAVRCSVHLCRGLGTLHRTIWLCFPDCLASPILYSLEAQGPVHPQITAEPMVPTGRWTQNSAAKNVNLISSLKGRTISKLAWFFKIG